MAEDKFYPSPGNACSSNSLQMSIPHLEFIYRLECEMAKDNHAVGAPFGGTDFKMIMPIVGGIVKGPQINGTIEPMSGADWGTMVRGTDVSIDFQIKVLKYVRLTRAFSSCA